MANDERPVGGTRAGEPGWEASLVAIAEAVRSIRFGTVVVVVQDGRVIQIEKTEKTRLRNRAKSRGADQTSGGQVMDELPGLPLVSGRR